MEVRKNYMQFMLHELGELAWGHMYCFYSAGDVETKRCGCMLLFAYIWGPLANQLSYNILMHFASLSLHFQKYLCMFIDSEAGASVSLVSLPLVWLWALHLHDLLLLLFSLHWKLQNTIMANCLREAFQLNMMQHRPTSAEKISQTWRCIFTDTYD